MLIQYLEALRDAGLIAPSKCSELSTQIEQAATRKDFKQVLDIIVDDMYEMKEIPSTNTLAVTGTVYRETGEVAENGLPVEVNIITQNLTATDVTGKTAGKGQYSVTFFDAQKIVAKAGDEILVTVKDAQGKLMGQSRHTLTAAEVEEKKTIIDVTPCENIITFTLKLYKGINLVSIPVKFESWRMSNLAKHIGKDNLTMIIRYDYAQGKFISYMPHFPDDSPANAPVQCGVGYIVVMRAEKEVVFEGNPCEDLIAAPSLIPLMLSSDNQSTSVFVVTGNVRQEETGDVLNKVAVRIRNLRTGQTVYDATGTLAGSGNYVATFVASSEDFMTHAGDRLEITAQDSNHRLTMEPVIHTLTTEELENWTLIMPLRLSLPKQSVLLQNYPNPFNPETWIPYQLAQDANVVISIYNIGGQLVRILHLGDRSAGIYVQKGKAAYWDGRDNMGEKVASGVYFYTLWTGDFTATRKLVIMK
jgi:flagellar hook assembly protein FlgD